MNSSKLGCESESMAAKVRHPAMIINYNGIQKLFTDMNFAFLYQLLSGKDI
jgi:hypothetical protein